MCAEFVCQGSKTSAILKLKAVMSRSEQFVLEHGHIGFGFRQRRHKNAQRLKRVTCTSFHYQGNNSCNLSKNYILKCMVRGVGRRWKDGGIGWKDEPGKTAEAQDLKTASAGGRSPVFYSSCSLLVHLLAFI